VTPPSANRLAQATPDTSTVQIAAAPQPTSRPASRFAVVACSSCAEPWAVETRHATITCPRCATKVETRDRRRLWEGDTAQDAQTHAGILRARAQGLAGAAAATISLERPIREARHDSPAEAAAAKASGITNKSQRAEAVALWMQRLVGPSRHDDLIDAMVLAGLEKSRAESEVIRMLVCDVLYEPRAGVYALTAE
jgi:hypothetical protein